MELLAIATRHHLSAMHPTGLCVTVFQQAASTVPLYALCFSRAASASLRAHTIGVHPRPMYSILKMQYKLCWSLDITHVCPLQVFQLLQPHFRYTLSINANARSSLINAGGVVEKVAPFPPTMTEVIICTLMLCG